MELKIFYLAVTCHLK